MELNTVISEVKKKKGGGGELPCLNYLLLLSKLKYSFCCYFVGSSVLINISIIYRVICRAIYGNMEIFIKLWNHKSSVQIKKST